MKKSLMLLLFTIRNTIITSLVVFITNILCGDCAEAFTLPSFIVTTKHNHHSHIRIINTRAHFESALRNKKDIIMESSMNTPPSEPSAAETEATCTKMDNEHTSRSTIENDSNENENEIVLSKINWRTYPIDYIINKEQETSNTNTYTNQQQYSLFDFHNPSTASSELSSSSSWSHEVYNQSLQKYNEYMSCQDLYIAPYIQHALQTLLDAYRLYGPTNVIGSFNGGKDAVVIMELMKAAHAKYYHDFVSQQSDNDTINVIRPRIIYFNHPLEFPQVYSFVRNTVQNYDLQMVAFQEGISFVKGLDILVKRNNGVPLSFVLGTRKTDPNALDQGSFAPSSSWMPPFMRVNPILDWTYGHTWHFLRLFKIPYCSLYDQGYTSLGNVKDTLPCPALLKVNTNNDNWTENEEQDSNTASASNEYWPAYMLKDWDQERAGRISKNNENDRSNGKESKKHRHDDKYSTTSAPLSSQTVNTKNENTGSVNQSTSSSSTTTATTIIDSVERCYTYNQSSNDINQIQKSSDDISIVSSTTTTNSQRSVGLLIIGDEILKGLTPDKNTHAAASALKLNNVPLTKVSVVSDDLDDIVNEIEHLSSFVDIIITSGGVGPTHDDITIKSVASALGSEMTFNQKMADLLRSKMNSGDEANDGEKKQLSEAQIKMATLPKCSKLKYLSNDENDWPVLQCKHVFILPGVPQFFEKKVDLVASYLSTELERSVAYKVVLSIDENSIVSILNKVVSNHPNVSFGSYPFENHPDVKTVVTLEGRRFEGGAKHNSNRFLSLNTDGNVEDDLGPKEFAKREIDFNVKLALGDLVKELPEGSILRVDNDNDLTFL